MNHLVKLRDAKGLSKGRLPRIGAEMCKEGEYKTRSVRTLTERPAGQLAILEKSKSVADAEKLGTHLVQIAWHGLLVLRAL